MKQMTRGMISIVCGIVCIVSSIIILAVRLIMGDSADSSMNIPMSLLWIALGCYFCYIGKNMRKADSDGQEQAKNKQEENNE